MDSRSQFILQILEKLGGPLLRAVGKHSVGSADGAAAQKEAQAVASLLSETVKISISLTQAMNLKPQDGDAEAIRVALAALAGSLVADSYAQSARFPNENDVTRITKSLESVLAFSDNFAPAAEHAKRLQTLEGVPPFVDPAQTTLYALNALVPVIAAVAEFPFGQQETVLIQDIATRLHQRARDLHAKLLGANAAASDGEGRMAELIALQALAALYAQAHRAETARLRQAPDGQAGGEPSLQPVWQTLDRQVAMLETLLGAMTGTAQGAGSSGSSAIRPETLPAQPSAEVVAPPPPQAPPPEVAQPLDTNPPAAAQAPPPAANPMSFFKKKE